MAIDKKRTDNLWKMNKLVNLLLLIVASNHLCSAALFEAVTGEKSWNIKMNSRK